MNRDTIERLNLLADAEEKLSETVDLIRRALSGTEYQAHAEAYILGHLQNWIDSSYSNDMGIQQYKDALFEDMDDEEEDEE